MELLIIPVICFITGGLLGALIMALLVVASNGDKAMANRVVTNNTLWWQQKE